MEVTLRDKPRDATDDNLNPFPKRLDLDIRLIRVTKLPESLRVVFEMAAPARKGTLFSFNYYAVARGKRDGEIHVRYHSDSRLTAVATIALSLVERRLPRGTAHVEGKRLVVDAPDRLLDPANRFPAKRFKWRATVSGANSVVSDDAPDVPESNSLGLADYP